MKRFGKEVPQADAAKKGGLLVDREAYGIGGYSFCSLGDMPNADTGVNPAVLARVQSEDVQGTHAFPNNQGPIPEDERASTQFSACNKSCSTYGRETERR